MQCKLKQYLALVGFTLGFSAISFAHEAPVVDAQQQSSVAATQPVASSGSGWQPVSADSGTPSASSVQSTPAASQPAPQEWGSSQQNTAAPASQSPDPLNRRVSRLEQQMSNYSEMNLPQQTTDMQQKVATLQGQLEVDQRELKQLSEKQKSYYEDLQQQIAQLKQTSSAATKEKEPQPSLASNDNAADTSATADTSASSTVAAAKKEKDDSNDRVSAQNDDQQKKSLVQNDNSDIAPAAGDAPMYQKAFRLLSKKHFNQAHDSFKTYLQNYPNGQFAVNAHFWMGEIALMNQHYDAASSQFETVVKKYPTSSKVSDAKLKIAMIHAAKGETDTAKNEFKQIRKEYPGSTAAQLASIRLQQISGGMSAQ